MNISDKLLENEYIKDNYKLAIDASPNLKFKLITTNGLSKFYLESKIDQNNEGNIKIGLVYGGYLGKTFQVKDTVFSEAGFGLKDS